MQCRKIVSNGLSNLCACFPQAQDWVRTSTPGTQKIGMLSCFYVEGQSIIECFFEIVQNC
jgi:hypothetical protein